MRLENLNELKEKNLVSEEQFRFLEPIVTNKIVSVFYELRSILYLGVMLFTAGAGILVYKNIGDIGHMISIMVLFVLTAICFHYALRHSKPYSNSKIENPLPYYDYIVLLGCLLFISDLTYLQIQYELFNDGMGITTLITAAFFFFAAYKFDHVGVLSLAITALASFWSISVSPQKWYSGDFFDKSDLHITAIIFGASLAGIALFLDRKQIKTHFTFSYLNFCSLIYLTGCLAGIFMNLDSYAVYLLALYAGCAAIAYYAQLKKSFLFVLYAFVAGYIGTTVLMGDLILHDPFIWFFYLLASCGGFIFFIIKYKSYFRRAT